MMGLLLLIPFLLIRFIFLYYLNHEAVMRAAYFAPLQKNEYIVYYVYQISNTFIFLLITFSRTKTEFLWLFYIGVVVYILGLLLLAISIVHFARLSKDGLNTEGIYKLSRNPMYVAYFVYFIGCVLLTQSFLLFVLVIIFQLSAHWIILSEERWCIEQFGDRYKQYMDEVNRYI